jgi:hypothetical protein
MLIRIAAAGQAPGDVLERPLGENRDAIEALLAMHGNVVAELLERLAGERLVLAFDFLEAADIGRRLLQPSHEIGQARLDAVDVPGGDQHYALDRERRAAAAGGGGVGIVDLEGCADQPVLEIDLGAEEVDEGYGIDQNDCTVAFNCGLS